MDKKTLKPFKRFANTIPPQTEPNSGVKKTIPDQSIPVREIAARYIRGQSVPIKPIEYSEVLEFGQGLDVFEAIDKARKEQKELQERYAQMVEKSNYLLEQKEKAAKAAKAAAQKEAREKARLAKIDQNLGLSGE